MYSKVFVVMMVKNEDDIIGYNIEYLQTQGIDHFYIANNLSTDNTSTILNSLKTKYSNITLIDDNEEGHFQSEKMTRLINECYEMGADYILPIDSDEKWYSKIHGKTISEAVRQYQSPSIFGVELIDFIPDKNQVMNGNPFDIIDNVKYGYTSFPKVAFTKQEGVIITDGNHDVLHHQGQRISTVLGAYHYQYRSKEQFLKKVRQNMTSIEKHPNPYIATHWRSMTNMSDEELNTEWSNLMGMPTYKYYYK
jgi:hypothetical protein